MLGLLVALQVAATPEAVPVTAEINTTPDVVWSRLIAHIAQRNLQPKLIDKPSGLIQLSALVLTSSRGAIEKAGAICPPSWRQPFALRQNVSILVEPAEPAHAKVSVTVSYSEVLKPSMFQNLKISLCHSDGQAEQRAIKAAEGAPAS